MGTRREGRGLIVSHHLMDCAARFSRVRGESLFKECPLYHVRAVSLAWEIALAASHIP